MSSKSTSPGSSAVALVGCGRIGHLLEDDPLRYKPCTHYGGAAAAGITITHACDVNAGRLARFSERAGIPESNRFAEYRALITDVRPGIVIIATWTDSHAEIGALAARNGARVIMCEKPIAHDLAAARRLISACARHRVRLVVNHERRYESRYRAVHDMLANGVIGEVTSAWGCVHTGNYRGASHPGEGGGPLLHDGTHLIDIIRFLLGDIRTVEGAFTRSGRRRGYEDRATAWLTTRSGTDVFIEAGGGRKYFSFELHLSGTEGRIVIGNGYQALYRARPSRLYRGFRDLVETPFPAVDGVNCFTRAYREVKRLANDPDAPITSSGRDGYRALEAVHAVYLSASQKGKRVELPVKPGMIDLRAIFKLS
ncbi:MAG TPA: Gfo/Idh/MocA family oxidoreductase [Spirochaetota bacterium]|nr:Gfo/Idh/MocA family oxidoreductase [Spirochaetota bacterium]HPU88692.1 Gfo/Idh/MocA family oxidoreductase [Spirochaetota bacterium]